MVKVSREETARNRARVVATAARQFRRHGYNGIGVVDLMNAAGLTHGGFYKRFAGKDALMVEATAAALTDSLDHWRAVIDDNPADAPRALRHAYLDARHVQALEEGCAYAALAGEAPRHGPELRQTFETFLQASIGEICRVTGDDPATRSEVIRSVAQMIGGLLLARAVESPDFAAEILSSAKR